MFRTDWAALRREQSHISGDDRALGVEFPSHPDAPRLTNCRAWTVVPVVPGRIRVLRGPSPYEARVAPRAPGVEERKAIVGAILEFPALVDDSEVARVSSLLEGESARIVEAIASNLRMSPRGEKVLNAADFLAQMSPRVQAFARERLASPAHETIEEARTTVVVNAKKLRETNIARETRETAREQERDTSDWEAQVDRANEASARVRERHGLFRG